MPDGEAVPLFPLQTISNAELPLLYLIREPSGAAADVHLISRRIITIICGGKGMAHQSEVLEK